MHAVDRAPELNFFFFFGGGRTLTSIYLFSHQPRLLLCLGWIGFLGQEYVPKYAVHGRPVVCAHQIEESLLSRACRLVGGTYIYFVCVVYQLGETIGHVQEAVARQKITLVVLTAPAVTSSIGDHVVALRGRDDTHPRDRNNLDAINLIKSLRRSAEFKQPQFDSVQERSLPWGQSHGRRLKPITYNR